MIHTDKKLGFCIFIISAVCFFTFFVNNLANPADYMESRNLATAQEMISHGNYLVPTMNGELRLEKPPLPTWIAAGVEQVFPDSLQAQRATTGLAGTAMVFFLFFLVWRLTSSKNAGLTAALICATCYSVIMLSRTATWDIYCHAFMLGAILFFVLALDKKGKQWGLFALSGLFVGLSFLSKGPVSLYALLLPFLVAYFAVYRGKLTGKIFPLVMMVLIAVVVSLWWYGYLYVFHSTELQYVLNKESGSWLNHNVKPFYYYWQFPAEAGIWAVMWVTSLIYFFVRRRSLEQKQAFAFSIIWMLGSLLLLSLMPEKKTRYLLPLLIPGSINIAMYLYNCACNLARRSDRVVFRLNTIVIAVIIFALPVGMYLFFVREGYMSMGLYIATSLVFVVIGGYMIFCIRRGDIRVGGVLASVVLAMVAITGLCMIPIGKTFVNDDRHSIKELRYDKRVEGLPFYYDDRNFIRMELVYESNKRIRPLDLTNDSLVAASTPFVLVTTVPAEEVLDADIFGIEYLDVFDNNWRKRGHKRYNHDLVSHTAVISIREQPKEPAQFNPMPE